jgi:hypothetical protein
MAASSANKGPVTVFTTTTVPFTQTGPGGGGDEPIILEWESPNSFTQKAGQMALIAADLNATLSSPAGEDNSCDLIVTVYANGVPVLSVMDLANRAGVRASRIDSGALAAPASARLVTLSAEVFVRTGPEDNPEPCLDDETFTFSIRVSVATMPS